MPAYAVNEGKVIQEFIDGEVIIVNMESGIYYSLLDSGAAIWERLKLGYDVDDIVRSLCDEYEESRPVIEAATGRLLASLQQEALIVPAPQRAVYSPDDAQSALKRAFTAPRLDIYSDMQDLLLLDPIHDTDEMGWPKRNPEQA